MTTTRGPRRRMSEQDFVESALAVVDIEGLQALNVRRLAAALEMSAGSLYTYFENKQALLDLMLRHAMSGLPLEDVAGGDPRAELLAAFRTMFEEMCRHPASAELITSGVSSPDLDLFRERLHRILEIGGIGQRQRVQAINLLSSLVIGCVSHGMVRGGYSHDKELARRRELDRERFPLLAEASEQRGQVPVRETFEFGLIACVDRVLAGADDG